MSQLEADPAAGRPPTFAMVVPDLDNHMHGVGEGQDPQTVLKAADDKAEEISRVLQTSPGWTSGSRLIFTWDEGAAATRPEHPAAVTAHTAANCCPRLTSRRGQR